MVIELRGVEFVNKGAELMLRAMLEKLREEYPRAIFVMEEGSRAPQEKIRNEGMLIKLVLKKYRFRIKVYDYLIPKIFFRRKGIILPSEIDVVFDASGFAFGDQWGANYAEQRIGKHIEAWRQQGKKVILLPQAFGPFETDGMREVMTKIINNATLVFTREKQSHSYLTGIKQDNRIQLAPDFTNLISGKIPSDFDREKNQVAIVPNYKMVEKNTTQQVYFDFLKNAVNAVRASGLNPYFLIHEGKRDTAIVEEINKDLASPLQIVSYDDPLLIKGIISTAKFIICSRFHGVVSSLSQAVPCLVTGWSHKYEMLVQEYGCPDFIIKDLSDIQELNSKINSLADNTTIKKLSEQLKINSAKQKERSLEMWGKVFKEIQKS
jgi:colanic acid/amylovoran biosynthesis protein